MAAKELSYDFTDYRRADGGVEQHNATEGELRLGDRWTLHFKNRFKKNTRYGGIARYDLDASPLPAGGCHVSVSDNQSGERFCEFTLPNTDAEGFAADLARLRENAAVSQEMAAKRDADGSWWTAPDAFKGLGWRGSVAIAGCAYMGGYSRHPKKHGDTNNLAIGPGGVAYRGFKEIFSIPWSEIAGLTVEGPEQAAKRITATRLVTLGVFALAAKKVSKSAVLIVDLHSGEQVVFHTEKLTAAELKGKLAPINSRIQVAAKRKAELAAADSAPAAAASIPELAAANSAPAAPAATPAPTPSGFSVADEVMKLKQLCDQGILTEEQFAAQRDKLLGV